MPPLAHLHGRNHYAPNKNRQNNSYYLDWVKPTMMKLRTIELTRINLILKKQLGELWLTTDDCWNESNRCNRSIARVRVSAFPTANVPLTFIPLWCS